MAFPLRMEMTKISLCKHLDGETIMQYLTRLTEIHDTYSGLERPLNMNDAEVTAYKAHLRNNFINEMKEDIAKSMEKLGYFLGHR